jgi:glycosyltransferase involved in cell wall biosynthesis
MNSLVGTRVMMTTDTVGGVWVFSTTLARALGAAGFEVCLVTLGPRATDQQRRMLPAAAGISLVETDAMLEWQDPAGHDFDHARVVLGDIADEFAPDLVHLNSFREATFEWKVPSVVVAHSCVNSWASACGETQAFIGKEWRTYTSNVRNGLRSADAWVAPTDTFREFLSRHYEIAQPGITIWNGADAEEHLFSATKSSVVFGAGRVWDKAKNLSALSSLAPDIDWPIRIAGPSTLDHGDIRLPAEACEFLGEIAHDELLRQMQAAAIFASPALYEPFGLSVLEAASSGCALLLSDIPTFRELWNGAALFFDPKDRDALRQCLQSLCGDAGQRMALQRAAADRAGRYSLESTVRRYRSVYASLLGTAHLQVMPSFEEAGVLA